MGQGPAAKPAPVAGPSKPAETSLPTPPTNPINRQDGWKDSRPSNPKARDEDVVMRDAKKFNPGDKYHVPLLQLVGLSPQLQKLFTDSTRSKREYANKSAEYTVRFAEADTEIHIDRAEIVDSGPRHVYADATYDEIHHFLDNYGSAIAQGAVLVTTPTLGDSEMGDSLETAGPDEHRRIRPRDREVDLRARLQQEVDGTGNFVFVPARYDRCDLVLHEGLGIGDRGWDNKDAGGVLLLCIEEEREGQRLEVLIYRGENLRIGRIEIGGVSPTSSVRG
ncbi:hypothetical protein B0H13DRAFT_1914586 [Mycena leptocephala]|nr:hypothetical protein B0H13DRAFT_1914586 [Mycena leptocephala]